MEYANPHALVSTDWLVAHLGDPTVRPIEVDEDTTLYQKGHIPGAVAWDWNKDLHHPTNRDYLDTAGFERLLRDAGVEASTTVVLYGGNHNWFAAGHIPGAKNVPWAKAANEDGTFKSADELKKVYGDAGVEPGGDTVAYCRIGERSSHTWFVLRELLGFQNVRNYDGSWTAYGSMVGVPVERG